MYAFENDYGGVDSYGAAPWWTAMWLTPLGSDYWPQTGACRVLCFFIALYGFAVFGNGGIGQLLYWTRRGK
jgi:voltage-gated potassium channel